MQHHIEKIIKRSYNASFKKNIQKDLSDILKNTTANMKNVIFVEPGIEHAIKPANKHAAPGTDQITTELIENGGERWTKSLTILMQACYYIGYFPKNGKKKTESTSTKRQSKLSLGKIIPLTITIYHDREILQEATNILGQAFIQALLSAAILP